MKNHPLQPDIPTLFQSPWQTPSVGHEGCTYRSSSRINTPECVSVHDVRVTEFIYKSVLKNNSAIKITEN